MTRDPTVALQLEGLSKRRKRRAAPGVPPVEDWALRDISLAVPRGSVFGLIDADPGAPAALLRVLCGLSPPTSGRAVVDGWMAPPVQQAAAGFDAGLSVSDNLAMLPRLVRAPGELDERGIARALRFAGVPGTEDLELGRLPTVAPARLAFAALLELAPDVLLCSREPLAGDASLSARAWSLIDRARTDGMAVVIATATTKSLRACDFAAWLDEGSMRQLGPAEEVAAAFDALHRPAVERPRLQADDEPPPPLRLLEIAVDAGDRSAGPRLETQFEATEPARVLVSMKLCDPVGEVHVIRPAKASRIAPGRVTVRADFSGVALAETRYAVTVELRWALEDGIKQRAVLTAEEGLEVVPGRASLPSGREPAWELTATPA